MLFYLVKNMAEVEFDLKFTFENVKEIISKVENDVAAIVLSEVRMVAQEILTDILTRLYPPGYSSVYYFRTGEIADCVDVKNVIKSGDSVSFEVYLNSDKLSAYEVEGDMLNVHMDIHGNDFREGLPFVLDQGSSGSPIYNHPGRHFMDTARGIMDDRLSKVLASGLRARGFKVTNA